MKPLLPGAMELPNDKYRIRIDELEEELEKEKAKAEDIMLENERLKKQLQELQK